MKRTEEGDTTDLLSSDMVGDCFLSLSFSVTELFGQHREEAGQSGSGEE